jgi:hypothetical protein
MNGEEFHVWMETQPDSFELIDGVPVRMADEKQHGRRIGNLCRAAYLALGDAQSFEWLMAPIAELDGNTPFLYVAESWDHLTAALQLLRDPENGQYRMGDRFSDICDRAIRLAALERVSSK